MSLIKSLEIKEKLVDVEFPDIEGFVITLAYLPKDELIKIRNKCLKMKFNRSTKQREEEIDNEKFLSLYCDAVIKGWKGLKFKHLSELMAVDLSNVNPNDEIPYSPEDALDLLSDSTVFDQFITDSMNDLELFSEAAKKEEEKNLKNTSKVG